MFLQYCREHLEELLSRLSALFGIRDCSFLNYLIMSTFAQSFILRQLKSRIL